MSAHLHLFLAVCDFVEHLPKLELRESFFEFLFNLCACLAEPGVLVCGDMFGFDDVASDGLCAGLGSPDLPARRQLWRFLCRCRWRRQRTG